MRREMATDNKPKRFKFDEEKGVYVSSTTKPKRAAKVNAKYTLPKPGDLVATYVRFYRGKQK